MIEFDIESTGLQWYADETFLVQFYDPDDEDCVISSYPERDDYEEGENGDLDYDEACELYEPELAAVVLRHPQDRAEIQRWLDKQGGRGYRAWNAKFDLHHLDAAGYTLPPQSEWHDGMLIAKVLRGERSAALQKVGDSLFGEEAGAHTEKAIKEWLKKETTRRRKVSKDTGVEFVRPNYSDVPFELMRPYAAHDVTLQRMICDRLEPNMIEAKDLPKVYELEQKVLGACYDVEKLGIPIDADGARAFEKDLERELEERTQRCIELVGNPDFNPGSGKQIGEALKRRGADLSKTRKLKNGLPATSVDALAQVPDELARAIEAYRSSQKLYGTYISPLLHPDLDTPTGYRAPYLAPDGRVHANIHQVGPRTGRMSSSDPNVQNWPRDDLRMRYLVKAQPGYKLVACDLDSIELRVFAAFVGDGNLKDMLIDPNRDAHLEVAEIVGLHDFDRGGGVIESARQRGKKFNYSMIYGAGTRSLREAFNVSMERAKQMIWAYRDAFPEVVDLQQEIEIALEDKGYIKTPWGRRHYAQDPRHVDREAYKFGNYLVQGTSADLFKESVVRVHEMGIPMVALTHDEILAEVRESEAQSAGEKIRGALIDHPVITAEVPLDAEAIIVDRWSEAKDADFNPEWS